MKERQVPERGGISLCIILQYKNQVYNTDSLLFMLSHVVKTVKTQMGRLDSNFSGGREEEGRKEGGWNLTVSILFLPKEKETGHK